MQGAANEKVVPDFQEMTPRQIMRWVGVHGIKNQQKPGKRPKTPDEKEDHISKLLIAELFPHIGTRDVPATRILKGRFLA